MFAEEPSPMPKAKLLNFDIRTGRQRMPISFPTPHESGTGLIHIYKVLIRQMAVICVVFVAGISAL